jgi:hypothetical protein
MTAYDATFPSRSLRLGRLGAKVPPAFWGKSGDLARGPTFLDRAKSQTKVRAKLKDQPVP